MEAHGRVLSDRQRSNAYTGVRIREIEIKTRKKFNEMEGGLQEAYDQIRDKKYEEGVLDEGYLGVRSYGICFCKKSCIVGKYDLR